jgi:hypothetical protein
MFPVTLTRGEDVTTFTVTDPGPVVLVERMNDGITVYQFSSPWIADVEKRVMARISLLEKDGWRTV